jgi:DNA-binding LacI/PurR family transcriptional regulator
MAGVSKATVSRVVNKLGNVHPETANAVRQAIRKAGYRPPERRRRRDRALGTVAGEPMRPAAAGAAGVLAAYALLIPEVSGGLYVSLQQGFEGAAQARHHQILVCNSENSVYRQADQILQLMHKRVAGIAIVTATETVTPPSHIEMLQQMGIPVVLLHRTVPNVQAPSIVLPLEQVGYLAARTMLAAGHRRVAIFPAAETESMRLHNAGFERSLREAGLESCPLPAWTGRPFTQLTPELEREVREVMERLWASPAETRPTALFATFDSIAELIYVSLMQMGVRVPDDISLVSFGGSQRGGVIASRLAAVVVDEAYAGERAAALFTEIAGGRRPFRDPHTEVMAISVQPGETLAVHAAAVAVVPAMTTATRG